MLLARQPQVLERWRVLLNLTLTSFSNGLLNVFLVFFFPTYIRMMENKPEFSYRTWPVESSSDTFHKVIKSSSAAKRKAVLTFSYADKVVAWGPIIFECLRASPPKNALGMVFVSPVLCLDNGAVKNECRGNNSWKEKRAWNAKLDLFVNKSRFEGRMVWIRQVPLPSASFLGIQAAMQHCRYFHALLCSNMSWTVFWWSEPSRAPCLSHRCLSAVYLVESSWNVLPRISQVRMHYLKPTTFSFGQDSIFLLLG